MVKSLVATGDVAVDVLVEVWAKPGVAQSTALKPSKAVRNRQEEAMCNHAFCNGRAVESRAKGRTAAGSHEDRWLGGAFRLIRWRSEPSGRAILAGHLRRSGGSN
jgi:hypothetical protein